MRIMRTTRITAVSLSAVMTLVLFGLAGCSGQKEEPVSTVKLSVWWSDEADRELINGLIGDFEARYAAEAAFEIIVSTENILTAKETVLANPQAAADIYMFADDQFEALRQAGVLLEVTDHPEDIIAANGGAENGACRAAMHDGKLYAYPVTAGNGYFLYYNSAYFTRKDIESLDRILEVCAENGKKATIDFSSGWYIYSFFKGAGLELGLGDDGVSNYCNWNAVDTQYTGVEVAEAMLAVATHDGFVSCDDQGFLNGVRGGNIIAGVNGAWNAGAVREAWGDYFAAAKLPCYTLAGDSVQMCSFSGYKLLGVNPYSENSAWAMKLAQYLSGEEAQRERFMVIGECPSNVNVASSAVVQSSPTAAALAKQSQYADTQNIADTYWNPSYIFGVTIAGANPDGQDLQTLLDTMTKGITARPGQED